MSDHIAPSLPVAIAGLGSYLPDRVISNDDLAKVLDTNDDWIRSRTGIRQRHAVADGQATSDLAAEAGRRALDDAGIALEDVTAILVATTTPDHMVPGTAPIVAAKMGTQAAAFDLNAACSGFVYGLQVGSSLAVTGGGPVLVIGAEALTRIVNPMDRSIAILFGDGAGAAVLTVDEDAVMGPFDLGADGTDPSMLWTQSGGTREPPTHQTLDDGTHYLTMRGGDVYRNAVSRMTSSSRRVVERAGISIEDVDLFVGHQANVRILEAVRQRLGIVEDRAYITVDQHGNTSAASVPLALTDARDAGRLSPGDTVLLTAFGAGLTWGSCLMTWRGPRA